MVADTAKVPFISPSNPVHLNVSPDVTMSLSPCVYVHSHQNMYILYTLFICRYCIVYTILRLSDCPYESRPPRPFVVMDMYVYEVNIQYIIYNLFILSHMNRHIHH